MLHIEVDSRVDGSTRLSDRAKRIGYSSTMAVALRASELQKAGRDVISLALGELDFDTPRHAVDAAYQAALGGFTRYTAADGAPLIKKAVIEKLARDNDLMYATGEIHVAAGCKQVIYNALAATVELQDEVIIFAPYWVSYIDLVRFCGGSPVVLETDASTNYIPSVTQIERAITPRTKWIIVNSPNNPSGAVYPAPVLQGIAHVLRSTQAMVLSDEIYEQLVYDSTRHLSILNAAPDIRDRTLLANGVSKTYAMTGWRVGFGAGPSWLIEAMGKIQSQLTGNPATMSQSAAAAALSGDQRAIAEWRKELSARRSVALETLATSLRLRPFRPSGAFYIFIDVTRCIGGVTPNGVELKSDVDVANYFLEAGLVAVMPGSAFGDPRGIRISFATSIDRLAEACRRMVSACSLLR